MSVTVKVISGGFAAEIASGEKMAYLYYYDSYREGDKILFSADPGFYRVKVDTAIETALVYLPTGEMEYRVPFGEALLAHPKGAFSGEGHFLSIRAAEDWEIAARRNLALNPADQRGDVTAYPHATANIETRGEAVFAARCAIDGEFANHAHGSWPCQSWGPDIETDPAMTVDFGREVLVDSVGLVLRADFPHDAWWERATVELSDGESVTFEIQKTDQLQVFPIGSHKIRSITLKNLVKAFDPSPFPALMEFEVYGTEA